MYSNKENVNILTSLLVAHGVRHAVVCPGSRNAAIVHNLNECEDITCYPVTDERIIRGISRAAVSTREVSAGKALARRTLETARSVRAFPGDSSAATARTYTRRLRSALTKRRQAARRLFS